MLGGHDTAVAVVADWIEAHAHTRYRIDGEVAVPDADGTLTATFRQHTSRAGDPQLHTHLVVANRVRSPDGRWLTHDARALKLDQRTLSAVYHATLRAELTRRLGVAWGPVVNGIADIAGVPDEVMAVFSSRTGDIARRIAVKRERFVGTFGREPTPRERWRLEREAVLDSRPAKKAVAGDLRAEWAARAAGLGVDPRRMVDDATRRATPRPLDARAVERAANDAVAALSERQSTWRPAELTREIAAALPTDAHLPADRVVAFLDWATRTATERLCVDISRPVPDGARLRQDGRPVTEPAAPTAATRTFPAAGGRCLPVDVSMPSTRNTTCRAGDAPSAAPSPSTPSRTSDQLIPSQPPDTSLIHRPVGYRPRTASCLVRLVGETGFEPATPCSQSRCAT